MTALRSGRGPRERTSLTPPRLVRFPSERDALEYATRSMVFSGDGGTVWRAWGPPEDPAPIGVEREGDRWKITSYGRGPREARAAVRAIFSLDHDLASFYRLVRREPVLRGTERRFRGVRQPRDASLYEALLDAVIGQQLSVEVARRLRERLLERTHAFLEVEGLRLPIAPTPGAIESLGPDGLRALGLSRAKSAALLGLADGQRRGRFAPGRFAVWTREEAIERLDEERGVGRWTAENALLRGLGRTDLFIAGDLGLRIALERFGVLPRQASEKSARRWADRWYPGWGSYATIYLWHRLVRDARTEPPG